MNVKIINRPIAIYGAGGLGREVKALFELCNAKGAEYQVKCFIDDREELRGHIIHSLEVLSLEDATSKYADLQIVAAIGDPASRQRVASRLNLAGLPLAQVLHPEIVLDEHIEVGAGCIICGGCVFTTDINVGKCTLINLTTTIGHDVVIGEFCTIGPGVHIGGKVHFGTRVFVGAGAVIVNGVESNDIDIGDDVTIGACSLVLHSLPSGSKVFGIPARPIPVGFR